MPKALKGNGQSFLNCSSLATRVTLGLEAPGSGEESIKPLLNTRSNIGLIHEDVVYTQYPTTNINRLVQNTITGVGKSTVIGFVVVPI